VISLFPKKELDIVHGCLAVYHTSKNVIRCDCSCTVKCVFMSQQLSVILPS